MTQDEIIEMAKEAGLSNPIWIENDYEIIETFASLVEAKATAKERERIHKAKECCILCEQKGVCNENTKDDETNTAKILGES